MPIRTLVSYVGTAVYQVVRGLLHHFLPLDEPANPEEAVRKAKATLIKVGFHGENLTIVGNIFKVARDTCGSPAVLKAAAAAFNAAAALEEIGVHASLLSVIANVGNGKAEPPEDVFLRKMATHNNFLKICKATEPTDSASDTKEAEEAPAESEAVDVLSNAVTFFRAAALIEELCYVPAPEISAIADVLNVTKDSSDFAAVLNAALDVFYAVVRGPHI